MIRVFVYFLLSLLVFFPETSLDTSLAFDKKSIYSIYLYKMFGLTISDWIVASLGFFVILHTFVSQGLRIGLAKPLFLVYLVYLLLGALFNLYVNADIKAYLYDVKVSLYVFVPYLALSVLRDRRETISTKSIVIVFVLLFFGAIYDATYIFFLEGAEYTARIGMPLILAIAPLPLLVGAWYYLKPKRTLIFGLVSFEYLSAFNRSNLGNIVWGSLSFFWLLFFKLRLSLVQRQIFMVLGYYIMTVAIPLLLIFNLGDFLETKKSGLEVRKVEIYNFIENSQKNFPILFGKGLGSTWEEVVELGAGDRYSQGVNVDKKYKFIWHNTLAGNFYKFGILGSLLIIFYLSFISSKLYYLARIKSDSVAMFLSFSIPAFVMMNVSGPGHLKGALLSSLILFAVNQKIRHLEL